MRFLFSLTAGILSCAIAVCNSALTAPNAKWNQPFPPFRILGNLYYVGASGISSFLVVTPQGNILIDGGFAQTAPLIEKNVAQLGFRMHDVKYLLNSHGHYDHCGGLAELKRASGATMVASEGDRAALESGHQKKFGKGQDDAYFPPVHVDRVIEDEGVVSLGDVTLTARLTPGHTKGCTTWTLPVSDHGRTYQAAIDCSTTVAGNDLVNNRMYPEIVSDYRKSFALLLSLPCDIFLGPHPGFFDMVEKEHRLKAGDAQAFVDSGELKRFVEQSQQDFAVELAKQEKAIARDAK